MSAIFNRSFLKQYKKLKKEVKEKFKKKLIVFYKDEFNPILNNHPLRGKYEGYRSINVTGDIRAIYKRHIRHIAIFVAIDSHSNLYK